MEQETPEVFGNPDQQRLQRRAAALWTLLKNDPAYSCHGRAVAVSGEAPDTTDRQIALARLQGVGPGDGVPVFLAADRREALRAAGLAVDEYVSWHGGRGAVDAARQVLAERKLPDDLDLVTVGPDTPAADLTALDALTRSCDVLLPMGRFIRGLGRPAICLMARDADGRVVGASAAVAQFHPDHPASDRVWWGMLATGPDRRGQGIALIMGAHALIAMADRHGYSRFKTGIRAGNAPSEKLCGKLGFAASDEVDMIAISPEAFSGGEMTK